MMEHLEGSPYGRLPTKMMVATIAAVTSIETRHWYPKIRLAREPSSTRFLFRYTESAAYLIGFSSVSGATIKSITSSMAASWHGDHKHLHWIDGSVEVMTGSFVLGSGQVLILLGFTSVPHTMRTHDCSPSLWLYSLAGHQLLAVLHIAVCTVTLVR